MLRSISWVGGLTTNSEHRSHPSMARRKGRSNYKQIKTGTVNLGTSGAQVHIAKIEMIDEALRGSFLNNVQFSVQQNLTIGHAGTPSTGRSSGQAFTMYLSYESSSWNDDAVIAAYTVGVGGGNGNLVCKRVIKTNETGSIVAEQIGPVHVWMEGTDISTTTDAEARVTLTAWGRMILLVEDF